jgi:phosphohistidine phosphatase
MYLYLLRHGEADTSHPDKNLHTLTANGREQIQEFAQRIDPAIFANLSAIEHSTIRRARESAELLRETAALAQPLKQISGFTPDDNPASIADQFAHSNQSRFIISHNPLIGKLVSLLLSGTPERVEFDIPPSTCIALERFSTPSPSAPYGYWRLRWFLPASLAPAIIE